MTRPVAKTKPDQFDAFKKQLHRLEKINLGGQKINAHITLIAWNFVAALRINGRANGEAALWDEYERIIKEYEQ